MLDLEHHSRHYIHYSRRHSRYQSDGRHSCLKLHIPSLKYFTTLIRDELKLKFRGTRILNKVKSDSDKTSLNWLRVEMGWTTGIHSGHPQINPYPNSQTRTR